MTMAIDRAGRNVVPKKLRERFGRVAGTESAIEASGECLRLHRVDAEPALTRKKGILVHHGDGRANLDVAAFLRAEKESRSRRIVPEGDE